MSNRRGKLGLGLLAAGLSTLLTVGPAHAAYAANSGAYSTSFVDGGGVVTDDFGEHYEELGNSLCYGCGNSSNTDIVALWQSILAAEDLLDLDDIDGQFGPATRAATAAWQQRYRLSADGMVGNDTWSRADDRLVWLSSRQITYTGSYQSGAVTFYRGDSSKTKDSGAYKLAAVWQYDRVKNMGGTRIHFNSSTIL
ncbi:peptidoglycan-binding protein [Streptomyces sp. NPDC127039]|uniref:peptidoglycan-binding domain-containing protein n=1 Tax=Streptomyces sp. NPDC127039 TaxID=3347115 RepID=UPI003668DB66